MRATCLYLATKLGDLMPELVIVGGLVPSLLIDQGDLAHDAAAYVGTMDLDLGLEFALVREERYHEVASRLRDAGFKPDDRDGRTTRQRWRISDPPVTVDFLIEPVNAQAKPGTLFSLTPEWAAINTPGLHLAFENSRIVRLTGETIVGETVAGGRDVKVCGAGAFVVLKSLAFRIRGENNDAYDLFYVLQNYGHGVDDVAAELGPLLADEKAKEALGYLREDFRGSASIGPRRAAEFLFGRPDEDTQADVAGFVDRLLRRCT